MTDAAFKRQQIRLPVEIVIRNHCTSGNQPFITQSIVSTIGVHPDTNIKDYAMGYSVILHWKTKLALIDIVLD